METLYVHMTQNRRGNARRKQFNPILRTASGNGAVELIRAVGPQAARAQAERNDIYTTHVTGRHASAREKSRINF